jgi:hypothetical protein
MRLSALAVTVFAATALVGGTAAAQATMQPIPNPPETHMMAHHMSHHMMMKHHHMMMKHHHMMMKHHDAAAAAPETK